MGLNGDSDSFQCGGRIIVSDPCYDLSKDQPIGVFGICGPHIFEAVEGTWTADVEYWNGNLVGELRAYARGYYSDATTHVGRVVAVDSGQAGVFDAEGYRNGVTDGSYHSEEAEEWYDRVSFKGMIDVNGVCSSSFGGDGCFDLYVDYTDDDKVGAIRIVFHEDEEDDWEDEEDEWY